eukprot:TRINITY_DN1064_c4_g1_i1.p1 TRINITY_DN1064_c4_g1~~TRINITY_DN1064_c4_g1_i1.p1  ORF type:complete len:571 (+),score=159.28 TRINITY_DN1064_c4_g1_i1:105-1817(+)
MSASENPTPPRGSELKIGDYVLERTLGVGSFGKVKLARHAVTGHKVAVKILNRKMITNMSMEAKISREIQVLKLFRHPHIIRLYEVIETATDIFMVMEYVSGGELFDYIVVNGKLSEDEARRMFQQIIAGVEYCHENKVVHRDLKPENVLLKGNNVKIADFGLSNLMRDGDLLKTSCGSPNYAAPEVISGQLYAGSEVDVWSCGVILYALLCAHLPFDDEHIPNLFRKIKGGLYTIPAELSASVKQLIQQMLEVDPLKRITVAEIRQHPWFREKLPRYLDRSDWPTLSQKITEPDFSILEELCQQYQVGMEMMKQLLSREEALGEQNKFQIAYHIVEDHRASTLDSEIRYYEQNREFDEENLSRIAQLSTSPHMILRREEPFIFAHKRKTANDESASSSGSSYPINSYGGQSGSNGSYYASGSSFGGMGGGSSGGSSVTSAISSSLQNQLSSTPLNADLLSDVPEAKKQQWRLGITSARTPRQIMDSLAQILRSHDLEWKVIGPYQLRCKTVNAVKAVRIGVQLFKVQQNCYLLDMKKLDGEICPFFEICSRVMHDFNEIEATEDQGLFQ